MTITQAAKQYCYCTPIDGTDCHTVTEAFKAGAKWYEDFLVERGLLIDGDMKVYNLGYDPSIINSDA